jgi:phage-related minor tail protein
MNTKLTLSIDEDVIQAAKEFAKSNNRSVSKLVEDYLYTISKESIRNTKKNAKITNKLAGILKEYQYTDLKADMINHIENKYR